MACPCYSEDDHAGEDLIRDIKALLKKLRLLFKKHEVSATSPQGAELQKSS